MFHNQISRESVPLVTEDADLFFENKIDGKAVNRDWSFLASLRAFLGHRIGDKHITFMGTELTDPDNLDLHSLADPNQFRLIYFRNMGEDRVKGYIEVVRQRMGEDCGWSPIEKVTQFYSGAFPVYAWSCEERNSAVVLTGPIDMRKLHALQACIPISLPWFFPVGEDGKKFTDDDYALCKSLDKSSPDEYKAIIKKIASGFDMREVVVRRRLEGITKRFHEIELRNAESSIADYERRIRGLYNDLEAIMRDRENVVTRVYGLKARLKEGGGGSDLVDYFLFNNGMYLHRVNDTTVRFTAAGYLENWDDDKAESIIENTDSFAYDSAGANGFDVHEFKRFLEAIFIDRSIRIRVYADFYLDLSGSVEAQHFDVHDPAIAEYMPNPHLEHYECFGDYKRHILECLYSGNIVQAFEYCVASSRSLNWGDGTVMSRFFEDVCDNLSELKCYELPDGTAVAVNQAIEWAIKE